MSVVSISQGTVRGISETIEGKSLHSFHAVPFAESPAGKRRFLPPVPVRPWEGVRDCIRPGAMAPQNPEPLTTPSSDSLALWDEETCLNLNIWTPSPDAAKRPVMVWIHGGAYVNGSNNGSMHDGGPLAFALDIVVVAINYRLGALGFLHLPHLLGPEYADSSNTGLLDQLEALRWTRRNISAFGGDPDNVTIFGESAGAAAVGTLLAVPGSEGFFRRAIMQSGTAERVRVPEESERVTKEFLGFCGLRESDATDLLSIPASRLLSAQQGLVEAAALGSYGVPLPFQPTVGTPSLPLPPLEAVRKGCNSTVDLLVGTNLNEGSFAVHMRPDFPHDPPLYEGRVERVLTSHFPDPAWARRRFSAVLAQSLGREPDGKEQLEACLSDYQYRQPSNRLLEARQGSSGGNYSYLFTWPSPALEGKVGACHALEIPFVFRQVDNPEAEFLIGGAAPNKLSAAMSEAWAAFARTGIPEAHGLPSWPDYSIPQRETMILDEEPRVESDPLGPLREFWQSPLTTRRRIDSLSSPNE